MERIFSGIPRIISCTSSLYCHFSRITLLVGEKNIKHKKKYSAFSGYKWVTSYRVTSVRHYFVGSRRVPGY